MKTHARVYGSGPNKDEGGKFHFKEVDEPAWVRPAQKHCCGCHDDFYNHRANCTGNSWCFMLKPDYAKSKTRPSCFHH